MLTAREPNITAVRKNVLDLLDCIGNSLQKAPENAATPAMDARPHSVHIPERLYIWYLRYDIGLLPEIREPDPMTSNTKRIMRTGAIQTTTVR